MPSISKRLQNHVVIDLHAWTQHIQSQKTLLSHDKPDERPGSYWDPACTVWHCPKQLAKRRHLSLPLTCTQTPILNAGARTPGWCMALGCNLSYTSEILPSEGESDQSCMVPQGSGTITVEVTKVVLYSRHSGCPPLLTYQQKPFGNTSSDRRFHWQDGKHNELFIQRVQTDAFKHFPL